MPENLREHLVVEHEVVGVVREVKGLEQFLGERTIAGVVFGKFRADHEVFRESEKAVGDEFPPRHAAEQRVATKNATAEHARMQVVGDHRGHRRNELWRVLIIGVHHDDDVGASFEREAVTGLLIAAVAGVFLVDVNFHAEELRCDFHGVVAAAVVHEDNQIHDALLVDFIHSLGDGFGRIVGGHDDDDFLAVIHSRGMLPEARARVK